MKKTLSALYQIIIDVPDVSTAEDFLRESSWNYDEVKKKILPVNSEVNPEIKMWELIKKGLSNIQIRQPNLLF